MPHAVRCPRCRALARVADSDLGLTVACPGCGHPFRADPPAPPVATRLPPLPAADDPYHPDPEFNPDGLTGVLLGLALLPLGVPLVWLLGRLTLNVQPVFSFAAPLAVAVGVAGLAVGVGLARGWSHAARVRWLLALAAGGYLAGGVLFVAPKDWPAAARKLFGPNKLDWQRFRPPDRVYEAQVPGKPREAEAGPLRDWKLRTFTATAGQPDDRRGVWAVRYTLADGVAPADPQLPDAAWLDAVRDALVGEAGGELTAETPLTVSGKPARELRLTLADRVTSRVVRVVRRQDKLVYAAAEGLFLSADGAEVQKFLDGLKVQ